MYFTAMQVAFVPFCFIIKWNKKSTATLNMHALAVDRFSACIQSFNWNDDLFVQMMQ